MIFMFSCAARIGMGPVYVIYGVGRFCMESDEWGTGRFSNSRFQYQNDKAEALSPRQI